MSTPENTMISPEEYDPHHVPWRPSVLSIGLFFVTMFLFIFFISPDRIVPMVMSMSIAYILGHVIGVLLLRRYVRHRNDGRPWSRTLNHVYRQAASIVMIDNLGRDIHKVVTPARYTDDTSRPREERIGEIVWDNPGHGEDSLLVAIAPDALVHVDPIKAMTPEIMHEDDLEHFTDILRIAATIPDMHDDIYSSVRGINGDLLKSYVDRVHEIIDDTEDVIDTIAKDILDMNPGTVLNSEQVETIINRAFEAKERHLEEQSLEGER